MDNNHITTLPAGTTLHFGTYRIERFLAKGGFGCTYLARHVMLNKPVAIKELFISDYCNRDASGTISVGVSSRKEFVDKLHRKFIAEAQAQCGMDHPGIVKVSDVFEENGTAYYVMDYIDGESLAGRLKRTRRPLSEPEALGYIRQAAEALRYVHSKGRLHLDIKPGNIMIDRQGRAILIDFGVSKQYDDDGQNNSTLLASTPGYAPPEQKSGEIRHFSPASDIYSLGATLYNLLTCNVVPKADLRICGDPIPPLPVNITPATREAIDAALQLEKNKRPQSITEFLDILDGDTIAEAELVKGTIPEPPKESDPEATRFHDNDKTKIHTKEPANKKSILEIYPQYNFKPAQAAFKKYNIMITLCVVIPIFWGALLVLFITNQIGRVNKLRSLNPKIVYIQFTTWKNRSKYAFIIDENRKWGLIDHNVKIRITPQYDFMKWKKKNELIEVKNGERTMLIDVDNNVCI